ncbi:hypothetical protein CXB35_14735 [Pseudomonas syringae]|nr:hypothetical protein CXB35_14735 [Pseudomonas syringae]
MIKATQPTLQYLARRTQSSGDTFSDMFRLGQDLQNSIDRSQTMLSTMSHFQLASHIVCMT